MKINKSKKIFTRKELEGFGTFMQTEERWKIMKIIDKMLARNDDWDYQIDALELKDKLVPNWRNIEWHKKQPK